MISRELALELKKTGFPYRHWEPLGQESMNYAPTLSELIEACGERFNRLDRMESGRWRACAGKYTKDYKEARENSPEEALAKLWLLLTKV